MDERDLTNDRLACGMIEGILLATFGDDTQAAHECLLMLAVGIGIGQGVTCDAQIEIVRNGYQMWRNGHKGQA